MRSPKRIYTVTAARSLWIRSGPGIRFAKVGVLRHGAKMAASTKTAHGFRHLAAGRWVGARYTR